MKQRQLLIAAVPLLLQFLLAAQAGTAEKAVGQSAFVLQLMAITSWPVRANCSSSCISCC